MNRKLGLRRSVGRLWHHFFFHKMTEPSGLAPTTQASTPASSAPEQAQPATENSQTLPIRNSKPTQPTEDAPASTDGTTEKSLSPAELKKKAKAEKAARRIREKLEKEGGAPSSTTPIPGAGVQARPPTTPKKDATGPGSAQKGPRAPPPRRGSGPLAQTGSVLVEQKKKKDDKKVAIFGHLYGQQRRITVAGATKEVHHAILALGMQLMDYTICGSSARCVATLLAFKRVIESYSTPLGTSLARHLTTHLSHQITYLSTCRPLSISQGNAIRALKLFIAGIDPSTPEASAKISLCEYIDSFIREKITVADQVIADSAAQKVQDGDVIVTFAGSSIVKQTLLLAHNQGKRFRVSIIDSRPLFEGKSLARDLAKCGLDVQYSLVHAITHAIKDATKVFLGAHAMTSNGGLYSRVGTALVAMSAKERASGVEIPVIVCCETIKFTDRVALDSIVVNEIADANELLPMDTPVSLVVRDSADAYVPPPSENKKGANRTPAPEPPVIPHKTSSSPLANWHDTPQPTAAEHHV
ncbi:Initiation factor 2B-related protein [Penicillium cf. griseofulvum]|nr:Initiation factor 2B-related protein [Penicillium cf. griseofulvum]